jgi:hypothetical protein
LLITNLTGWGAVVIALRCESGVDGV